MNLSCCMQKATVNRRSSPVLLPNRRRLRTPSPSLPDSSSPLPSPSFHDGLAALHEAATSPERQPRSAPLDALPMHQTGVRPQSTGAGQHQSSPMEALPVHQSGMVSGPGGQGSNGMEHQQPALEPAYKKKKMSHLRVALPGGVSLLLFSRNMAVELCELI